MPDELPATSAKPVPGDRPATGKLTRMVAALRVEERVAVLYVAATALLFAARGYPFTVMPLVRAYAQFVGAISILLVPAWFVGEWWRRRTNPSGDSFAMQLFRFARLLAALVVVLVAYTNLKCRILLLHPQLFDRILRRLDDILHIGGGDLLARVASFHSPALTPYFHFVYLYAWAALAVPLAVAAARAGERPVRRTILALLYVYAAGALLYIAVPSLGPAFVERANYRALAGTVIYAMQESMQLALRYTVENPRAPAAPFFGLAAFPSLHLATSFLGILVAWRTWKPLLVLLIPWNLAIAASAVYFGWHYVVDFYPAIGLAFAGWWLAGRQPKLLAPQSVRLAVE